MPEHGIDPLSRVLGSIEAQLSTITDTLAQDRVASAQYRTDMRKEMQSTRDSVAEYRNDIQEVKRDVAEMKPKVARLEQRALMSRGATNFAIMLGKGAHAISMALGGLLLYLMQWFFGGGPRAH